MTLCNFVRSGDVVTCSVCGSTIKTAIDERTLRQNCGEEDAGRPQPAVTIQPRGDCVHRGEKIREGECNLCSFAKGQPFDVFACSLHGECSLNRKHSEVRGCAGCGDYLAAAESAV